MLFSCNERIRTEILPERLASSVPRRPLELKWFRCEIILTHTERNEIFDRIFAYSLLLSTISVEHCLFFFQRKALISLPHAGFDVCAVHVAMPRIMLRSHASFNGRSDHLVGRIMDYFQFPHANWNFTAAAFIHWRQMGFRMVERLRISALNRMNSKLARI